MKKKTMRTMLGILTCTYLLMGLAGCSDEALRSIEREEKTLVVEEVDGEDTDDAVSDDVSEGHETDATENDVKDNAAKESDGAKNNATDGVTDQDQDQNDAKDDHENKDEVKPGNTGTVGNVFQSDWKAGNENFYGYGSTEEWNRSGKYHNYVVQDKWLYYSNGRKIYKMPVGGKAEDVKILYDNGRQEWDTEPIGIEVVKNWIYFCVANDGLYRIRTDGNEMEKLVDKAQIQISPSKSLGAYSRPCNNFYVYNEYIYYVEKVLDEEGSSKCALAIYNLSSRMNVIAANMRTMPEFNEGCRLVGGFEDNIVLAGCYEDDDAWLLKVNDSRNVKITDQYSDNVDYCNPELYFKEETTKKELYLSVIREKEAFFENGSKYVDYLQAKVFLEDFEQNHVGYAKSGNEKSSGPHYVDLKNNRFFGVLYGGFDCATNYQKLNFSSAFHGINKSDPDYVTILHNDSPKVIIAGFDDYVYYSKEYDHLPKYRVKYDGSGEEEDVTWMFR